MNRKLIVGAVALVISGCGTSANGPLTWKNAKGPILTWKNNAKYSTIEIERADRVGNECGTWRPLATIPGNVREVKALEGEGGHGVLPAARLHVDRLLGLHRAKLERSIALTTGMEPRGLAS